MLMNNFISLASKDFSIDCNTSVLTPFALNVNYVNIVINHGVELKAKAPPLIYHFMFWRLKSMPMVIVLADGTV